MDVNGGEEQRAFTFTIDTVPPTMELLVLADAKSAEFLEVRATDAVGPVTVTCRMPNGKDRKMRPAGKDRPGVFRMKIPKKKLGKGEHVLTLTARDAVGLETTEEHRLTLP